MRPRAVLEILQHDPTVQLQALSKGGTFVGSNKLKHMTMTSTAMSIMELNWKGGENFQYVDLSFNMYVYVFQYEDLAASHLRTAAAWRPARVTRSSELLAKPCLFCLHKKNR